MAFSAAVTCFYMNTTVQHREINGTGVVLKWLCQVERGGFFFGLAWTAVFLFLDGNLDLGLTKCSLTRARGSGHSFAFCSSLWCRDPVAKSTLLNCQLVQNERLRQSSCLSSSYLCQSLRPPRCHFAKPSSFEGGWEAKGGLPARAPVMLWGHLSGHAVKTPESLRSSWKFGMKFESVFPPVN